MKEKKQMRKLLGCLLLMVCLIGCFKVSVYAAENERVINLTGIKTVKIYTADKKQEIEVKENSFTAVPGEYCYEDVGSTSSKGAGGYFTVTEDTTELKLNSVMFSNVSPTYFTGEEGNLHWAYLPELGTLTLYDEKQEKEYWHGTDSVYNYIVPVCGGDSYYNFTFTPFDENYLPIEGHFYVYGQTNFGRLNLSDSGRIPYLKKSYITVKAPVDMEVYTTWELKFYTARNWKSYEAYKTEDGYNYYKIPEGFTYMMRQEGKVTRYTKSLNGEWNDDHTEVTVAPLEDNPTQIHREQEKDGIYASMLTNLPENSEIDLKVGEYFDLVPLRAWQAVADGVANEHNDPDWHYVVIGGDESIASVEVTEDDKIGQFGRIHANGEGTVLVAFYYDAMENASITGSSGYIYSALLPELTGIAVVHVGEETAQTQITSNIDMIEGRTVYYVKSQTGVDGITDDMNDSVEYTFTPTATTGENPEKITSVRVHKPITVTDGKLSSNPSSWLKDSSWTTYQANETEDGKQSYTIKLSEGRNIVEIKAGDATSYHVILARGLDVTIDNVYRPGQKLESGDTVKVTLENMIPPMFKMSAIYNPAGVDFVCKANGIDYTTSFGQYMAGSNFNIKLQDEDAGTYKITEGALTTHAWGASDGAHRRLTRNAMAGYWNGGNNPDIDYGKMAYIPEISFEVESNDEYEESVNRSAGVLKALGVRVYKITSAMVQGNIYFATAQSDVPQNSNAGALISTKAMRKRNVLVGAEMLKKDENAKLLVRYWFGNNKDDAVVEKVDFSEAFRDEQTKDWKIYGKALKCTGQDIVNTATRDMQIEAIVVPGTGSPMTYATYLYDPDEEEEEVREVTGFFIPKDITISSAEGSGALGRWDGVLEADDITYNDSEGNEVTQDLGYGFIGTEEHFTTSVPNGTDKILVDVEGEVTVNAKYLESYSVSFDGKTYENGEAIPLEVGVNKLTVTCNGTYGKSRTYTIDVTRRTAAKQTAFEVPEGASVLVMQGSKTMKANEDGTYTLENGTYTYYVSKSGFLTKTDSFKVTDEETTPVIRVESLEAVPAQSGTVSVQLAGQSTVFCPTTDVTVSQEAKDLAANRYVLYNHGGYTVLHALLDAANTSGTGFECYKGKLVLVDDSITENNGKKSGWICKVNGVVCDDPANTLASDGDKIEFFYNSGWDGMKDAHLTPEVKAVNRGETVTLTLAGAGVSENDANAEAIADAEIYEGSTQVGTTNANGQLELETNTLSLGTHRFTAVKKDESGHNLLTAVMSSITVNKVSDPSADPNKTVVTFRLIGDTKHGEEGSDNEAVHAYTTWIATGTYTFDQAEVTVGDVFKTALDEAGLSYEGIEKNYISSITAPEIYGSYELKEMDNGKNSGWMYTVNGVHPDKGLNEWYVTTGDEIVWHYIDDYKVEQADMKDDSGNYATGGNASTWNKWLEAVDETPGAKENAIKVINQIKQIDETIELTDECEAKITTARKAYDALTREEKGYVSNYDVLLKAEEQLSVLKKEKADKEAADAVIAQIDALPTAENVTLEHQEAVNSARDAYSKLTDDQKKLVSKEITDKLERAEKKIAQLLEEQAADLVLEEINALPSKDNLTLDDEVALAGAEAHYNALSDAQKEYLTGKAAESVAKLGELRTQLEKLKKDAADKAAADAVTEKLNALPSEEDVMFQDEAVLKQAREAYEQLDDTQKALVSNEAYDKLEKAEKKLEALKAEVEAVTKQIQELPAVGDLTLEDEEKVALARSAYDALNADQKRQLTESGVLDTLLTAENQISLLEREKEEAEKVAQQINSLPEVKDLKLADKTAVEAARKAYDALSDNQKAMIEDAKKALEEREAEIKRLQELADNTDKPDPDNKDDDKKDDNKDNNKDKNTSTTDKNNNKGSGTTTGTTNKGSNTTTGTTTNKGTQSGSTNKTTGTTTGSQAQTSGKQGTDSSVKSAKTGDETDFLLPMAGLIGASGAFAGVILYYKKRRKDTGVETKEEK
ncbi:DUF4430 domain-containing protein [Blautia stercoris]